MALALAIVVRFLDLKHNPRFNNPVNTAIA
jgi:hypothetical protein